MLDIFDLYKDDPKIEPDTYTEAYPALISYCQNKETLSKEDLIILAHAVYGWMPTILDLFPKKDYDYESTLKILNKAKNHGRLEKAELEILKACINNSIVGASKLLHMIVPDKYPIWDSKIYQFLYAKGGKVHSYQVNNTDKYVEYIELLEHNHLQDPRFPEFYDAIKKKLDYPVSKFRAIEMAMFQHIKNQETA